LLFYTQLYSHFYNYRIDACESAVEIVTPYWASNSAGKIRAIVNTQHLQQAIQQEVCQSVQTKKCNNECSCEQKYKWHRLLAYDPDDDCKGIFMDWFLFPSCCVCRCTTPIK
ncbi:protein spaetzle 3-like, partial [Centruroides sculpturatus]|uniref:protein spaetzle 3-like n=1 Tax=Centruroides sculpturatus TaxID=218467 RepID=UPI000C6DB7AA